MSGFALANELAILVAGRRPSWQTLSDSTNAPLSDAAGVALGEALVAAVNVSLRSSGELKRRAVVTVTTFDAASTYRVSINGTNHDKATPLDVDEALTELRDAINGGAQASVVTAVALDADGVDVVSSSGLAVSLEIVGDVEDDFYIAVSVTSGSGVLACQADPVSASCRFFGKHDAASGSTSPSGWSVLPLPDSGELSVALTWRGIALRMPVAGLSKLSAQVYGLTKHASDGGSVILSTPTVSIGPCILE